MRDERNIILIGFMGSGKSTVAEVLHGMGFNCIDLDALIVERSGRTIPEIFARDGEGVFRDLETEALRSLAGLRRAVVSTGGGIVGREENWILMKALGTIVYLQAGWETLRTRLAAGEGRPLADKSDWSKVEALWRRRLPLYEKADLIVDTDDRTPEEVAERIMKAVSRSWELGVTSPGPS